MSALDTIELRGIRAWGHHGADPGELDLAAARGSDDLADTVNYAQVHADVVRIVAGGRFALLERLGDAILEALMADPRIVRARIAIAKPGLLAGATPAVALQRER